MNSGSPRVVRVAGTDATPDLGQQIRELRTAVGLTQHELALRSGTSQPAIATIESNRRVPTLPTLTRLAQALGHDLLVVLPCGALTRADSGTEEAVS